MNSEKRFTFDDEVELEIFDKETGQHYDGRIGHQKILCILLNELSEENEQLRQQNRKLYKCALYGKTIGDDV